MYRIILASEEYGEEEFYYKTHGDAVEGLARLQKACLNEQRKDKVKRTLNLYKPICVSSKRHE